MASRIRRGSIGGRGAVHPIVFTTGGPPTITGYDASTGVPGDVRRVSGANLTTATAFTVCGYSASFTVDGNDLLVTIPDGYCKTGVMSVTTPEGSADGPAFTLLVFGYDFNDPTVTDLSPGLVQTLGASMPDRVVALTASTAAVVTGNGPTFDVRAGVRGIWASHEEEGNCAPRNMSRATTPWVGSVGFSNAELITDGAVTGPDGVSGSATKVDPNGGYWVDLPPSGVTPTGKACCVSIWVRDDAGDPPQNGAGSMSSSVNTAQCRSTGTGNGWRRVVLADAARVMTSAGMRLYCSGIKPPGNAPSVDYYAGESISYAATDGSTDYFAPAAYMSRWSDLPPAWGANPNGTTTLPALATAIGGANASAILGTLLDGTRMGVRVDWMDSPCKSADGWTKVDGNNQRRYLFRVATSAGEWWFRLAGTAFAASIAGITSGLTSGATSLGIHGGDQHMYGMLVNDTTANRTVVRLYVNGCYDVNAAVATTSVGSNATPTAVDIGSVASGAEPAEVIIPRITRIRSTEDLDDEQFVIIGDSTSGTHNNVPATGGHILTPAEALAGIRIANYAKSGDGIVTARARWNDGPHKGKSTVKLIYFNLGINDSTSIADFATIEPYYTAFFADIRSTNPTAKLVLMTCVPCASAISGPAATCLAAIQNAVVNTWDSDGVIDTRAVLDTNSDGSLNAGWSPDGIHIYHFVRRDHMAPAMRASAVGFGFLS